jgi:hypothetical protein
MSETADTITLTFSELLERAGIDPATVILLRHKAQEDELNRRLPWLIANEPDIYSRWQSIQGASLTKSVIKLSGGYIASFIRHGAGRALFVGLYPIGENHETMSRKEVLRWYAPAMKYGAKPPKGTGSRTILDLHDALPFYSELKGKLIIDWPGGDRSWWRRAQNMDYPIHAICEQSVLTEQPVPDWDKLIVPWDELAILPRSWKNALKHWRGVYYIFDTSDGKGYVGSAYGDQNLLGRWKGYAKTGHGGNKKLKGRKPENFIFSILELTSPIANEADVIALEGRWKTRLHTREYGLNEN